ncbi:MAG: thiamine pyrophosphate-dependent enzyme [Saprospiraceae bacterium]
MLDNPTLTKNSTTSTDQFVREVLEDFRICCISREVSLMARKEVLTGKAKFGITGDGKEVPQVAMARAFKKGDWRSGYYRDQTFMFAIGVATIEDFFAQLYADANNDKFSGGRQMNSHYATKTVEPNGEWTEHKSTYNVSSDVSCTAGQMARAVGLSLASKKYREAGATNSKFSDRGNEVTFVTIGDASTSEGVFWESINAAGVMQIPMAVSVWDDGYGISVPKKYQTSKSSISKVLSGFGMDESGEEAVTIYKAKGWDYATLREMYQHGIARIRKTHRPALFHIEELTQPQGHSTSGSHERYKTKRRLEWERQNDCILRMKQWIVKSGIAPQEEVDEIWIKAKKEVKEARKRAWNAFNDPMKAQVNNFKTILEQVASATIHKEEVAAIKQEFKRLINPVVGEITQVAKRLYYNILDEDYAAKTALKAWLDDVFVQAKEDYHTNLYSRSPKSALNVPVVYPKFAPDASRLNGYEILNKFFRKMFNRHDNLYAFGEDVGHIGDVNQGMAGLQEEFGIERIFDTGIREWTIMGQALGMAMRGMRPIAEIQYLDYLIYGLEPLSDDMATLRYRSDGLQQAPAIIRTRGHRLEGIWHAGSPMSMLLSSLRGMYICVPRDMTRAAGMYNTLLQSDDPAVVVECLNGYRLKERLPSNIGDYTLPLGVPEVLAEGEDVTLVTYGSCIRIAQEGMKLLKKKGITVELIDVQTLLPFDLEHRIVESLKKTNRIIFMDEDIPGGATAYLMQEVLEKQNGYQYLDSKPLTLTAYAHRPPYGSDGDYFTKPNPEDVFETVYQMMHEVNPQRFPSL